MSLQFAKKARGFTWSPYNLLADTDLDPILDVPNQFFHDWTHMVFVGGIFNLTLLYFLESVRDETNRNVYSIMRGYVGLWNWPKRLKLNKLADLCTDAKRTAHVKAGSFKC